MLEGLFNFPIVANHLIQIGIFCILALSLNLINGSLGAFSLGHHGFWGMGGYAAAAFVWVLGSPDGSLLVFLGSFVVAMLAAAIFGLLVGTPCLRLRGDYLAIATLGFAEIFVICVRNSQTWYSIAIPFTNRNVVFGPRGLGGAAGFSPGDGFNGGNDIVLTLVGGSDPARKAVYLLLTWSLVAATFILIRNLIRSGHGRAIHAIRDDETAAELIGVNLFRYKVLVFVVAAALAGVAGALFANYSANVSPNHFLMMQGIRILLMVVLGGLGSMSGTLIAVIVLYTSEQLLGTLETHWPFFSFSAGEFSMVYRPVKDLWQVLFPLLLIVMMLRWPRGITRGREISKGFLIDALAERRATFQRWIEHPIPMLLALVQWGQLLWALPASETLFQGAPDATPKRIAFLAASLAIFSAGHFARRAYWRRRLQNGWVGAVQP
ncbi:MAG TPA: branched-chain amino acid ABC transporter permease [Planctomycetota bacterium]|jgi:branched-chain amino acid transport system permease protein